ncbi:MAG: hypothetical protein BGO67_05785 [Alphaproteobacteria bacterium 41-28]|nr:MAG: hypothetical protein BGO67_05785 [Alphaproteobacteria bacterium 41-28]
MFKKLYILPLLASVCFLGTSPLQAMEEQEGSSYKSQATKQVFKPEPLTLKGETFEETIGIIHDYLEATTQYTQKKLANINKIYKASRNKEMKKARVKFTEFYGIKPAADRRMFFKQVFDLKETYENIIRNTANVLSALNEETNGYFRYARDYRGALLLSTHLEGMAKFYEDAKKRLIEDTEKFLTNIKENYKASTSESISDEYYKKIYMDEISFYRNTTEIAFSHFNDPSQWPSGIRSGVELECQMQEYVSFYQSKKAEAEQLRLENIQRKPSQKPASQKGTPLPKAKVAQSSTPTKTEKENRNNKKVSQEVIKPDQKTSPTTKVLPQENKEPTEQVKAPLLPLLPLEEEKPADDHKKSEIEEPETQEFQAPQSFKAEDSQEKKESVKQPRSSKDRENPGQNREKPKGKRSKVRNAVKPIASQQRSSKKRPPVTNVRGSSQQKPQITNSVKHFETREINHRHKEFFMRLVGERKDRGTIEWHDVVHLTQNGFNGKVTGYAGGSKRQLNFYLLENAGEPTQFKKEDDYIAYRKELKRNPKLDYRILHKQVHTEEPHPDTVMRSTGLKWLVKDFENMGLTPQSLGWK